MAAIPHQSAYRQTEFTHTGNTTWTTVTDTTIADTDLTNGNTYLVWVVGHVGGDDLTAAKFGMRSVHGSTVFTDSTSSNGITINNPHDWRYFYFDVHTIISTEDIHVEVQTDDGANTVRAQFVTVLAIDITDLSDGTDYHFDEDTATEDVPQDPSAWLAGPTFTFQPGTADNRWLVISCTHVSFFPVRQLQIRINVSGGLTQTEPLEWSEGEDNSGLAMFGTLWVYTLGASSHTFTHECRSPDSPDINVGRRALFAIDLDGVFEDVALDQNAGEVALTTTDWDTTWSTVSLNPTTTGDCFIIASVICDSNSVRNLTSRHRKTAGTGSPKDVPDGATTDNRDWPHHDPNDEDRHTWIGVENLASGTTHTYEHQGHINNTGGGPAVEDRTAIIFSAELAAAAAPLPEVNMAPYQAK